MSSVAVSFLGTILSISGVFLFLLMKMQMMELSKVLIKSLVCFCVQTKLMDLEEAMRRVSAERSREHAGRTEAEGRVRKQTEQLALLEGAHQRRQQSALNVWNQEKVQYVCGSVRGAYTHIYTHMHTQAITHIHTACQVLFLIQHPLCCCRRLYCSTSLPTLKLFRI